MSIGLFRLVPTVIAIRQGSIGGRLARTRLALCDMVQYADVTLRARFLYTRLSTARFSATSIALLQAGAAYRICDSITLPIRRRISSDGPFVFGISLDSRLAVLQPFQLQFWYDALSLGSCQVELRGILNFRPSE